MLARVPSRWRRGAALELVEVPAPTPAPGERVIDVRAAAGVSVGPSGVALAIGGAGVVLAGDRVGERVVWGCAGPGRELAELVCVPDEECIPVPDGLLLEDAVYAAVDARARALVAWLEPAPGARVAVRGGGALAALARDALQELDVMIVDGDVADLEFDCDCAREEAPPGLAGRMLADMRAYLEALAAGRRRAPACARVDWTRAAVGLTDGLFTRAPSKCLERQLSTAGAPARRVDMPAAARPAPAGPSRSLRPPVIGLVAEGGGGEQLDPWSSALARLPGVLARGASARSPWRARQLAERGGFRYATTDPARLLRDREHDVIALWCDPDGAREAAAGVRGLLELARAGAGPRLVLSPALALHAAALAPVTAPGRVWLGLSRGRGRAVRRARGFMAGRTGSLTMRWRLGLDPSGSTPRDALRSRLPELLERVDVMASFADALPTRVAAISTEDAARVTIDFSDGSRGQLFAGGPATRASLTVTTDVRRVLLEEGASGHRLEYVGQDGRRGRAHEPIGEDAFALWAAIRDALARPDEALEQVRARREAGVLTATLAVDEALRTGASVDITP